MDAAKKYELFGSDSESSDDEPAPEPAQTALAPAGGGTSDEEGLEDDNLGDVALFGDDDEEGSADEGPAAPAVPSAAPIDYDLPVLAKPDPASKIYMMRLPNILECQPRPFDPETYDPRDDGAEEDEGEEASTRTENVIRWREAANGRESNTRLVTWSDGSMTMHVGGEVLSAAALGIPEGSTHLYIRHKGSNLECQGVLKQKLQLKPASIHSKTHAQLTKKIAREHADAKAGKGIKHHVTMADPEMERREQERAWNESNKLQARQAARARRDDDDASNYGRRPELSSGFLDDDELDGNLGALRKAYKEKRAPAGGPRKGTAGRATRKSGGGGGGRRRKSRGSDSEGSDDDGGADSEDSEDGDPNEMDGFLVQGGSSEEGEAQSSEEEEEEERPKKKKKKGRKAAVSDSDSD